MLFGTRDQQRAEAAGHRLGLAIGRILRRSARHTADVEQGETVSLMAVRETGRSAQQGASRVVPAISVADPRIVPAPNSNRIGHAVTSVLGVGLELPWTRPLLRGLVGVLQAELLLAGISLAPLLKPGSLSDPSHLSSAMFTLAAPLLEIALQPIVGPLLAELALGSIAVTLIVRARNRSLEIAAAQRAPLSELPVKPSVWRAPQRRLTAAG